jgi:hypothetical protein
MVRVGLVVTIGTECGTLKIGTLQEKRLRDQNCRQQINTIVVYLRMEW